MGCQVFSSNSVQLFYTKASWCAVRLCRDYSDASQKQRNFGDEPWFDAGVSASDVKSTNERAPEEMPEKYKDQYNQAEYQDARSFIKKCAEAGNGFSVSY